MSVSGNAVVFQLGKESAYGTLGTATEQIQISSESLRPTYNKISEGLATGGKGEGFMATMGKGVEGSISTLFRADMGLILGGALGKEANVTGTDAKTHVFTCIESAPNVHLPSLSALVDRKVDAFSYTGLKINRLSLSASQGDYLKCDVDFVGKAETESATMQTGLTPSTLKAFKFAQGKVYNGDTAIADIKSMSLELNNNLDYQTQTTDTGDFYKEAEVGTRSVAISLEAIYAGGVESLRKDYYKTDDTLSLTMEFTSDASPYKLTIDIPCCQMNDASANMSDPSSSLSQTMSLNAVDNLDDEFITMTLVNTKSDKYI